MCEEALNNRIKFFQRSEVMATENSGPFKFVFVILNILLKSKIVFNYVLNISFSFIIPSSAKIVTTEVVVFI